MPSKFFSVWVLLGIDSPVSWNQSINYMSELGLGSYLLPSASWQAPLSNMVTSSGNLKSSAMNHLKICSELQAASAPRFLKFGMEYLEEGYLSRSINNLNFFLACHSVALCMPLLVIRWTFKKKKTFKKMKYFSHLWAAGNICQAQNVSNIQRLKWKQVLVTCPQVWE